MALWTHALCDTEGWACALMKRMIDETGANATAIIHRRIPCTNHAQQIIVAFKRLRWTYPDAIPQGLKKHGPLLTTTDHIINHGGDRLDTQPTPPQHMDKVLNDTHLMMKCSEKSARPTSGFNSSLSFANVIHRLYNGIEENNLHSHNMHQE